MSEKGPFWNLRRTCIGFDVCIGTIVVGLTLFFLIADFGGMKLYQNNAKYLIVLLTPTLPLFDLLLTASLKQEQNRLTSNIALLVALLFTAISDYFLLFRLDLLWVGLLTFSVAQLAHLFRLHVEAKMGRRHIIVTAGVWVALSGLFLGLGLGLIEKSATIVLGAFYAATLLLNFGESVYFAFAKKGKRLLFILLSLGFALFVACDVSVGLNYIGVSGVWPLMWLFYAPSQLLLALSHHGSKKETTD